MVLDPPSSEEEPTNVVETNEDFAHKKTSLHLEDVVDTPRTARTPKVHQLGPLLREAQNQRLGALRKKVGVKQTLVSGAENDPRTQASAEDLIQARDAALSSSRKARPEKPRRLWLVLLGGQIVTLLLVAWLLLSDRLGNGSGDVMTVELQIEPPTAKADVGGTVLTNPGIHELPCDRGRTLTLSAPGFVTERHHLRCGDHLVLRLQLSPQVPTPQVPPP